MDGFSNGWPRQFNTVLGSDALIQEDIVSDPRASARIDLNLPSTGAPEEINEDLRDVELRMYIELLQIFGWQDACNYLTRVQDSLSLQETASLFWQTLLEHSPAGTWSWQIPQKVYTGTRTHRRPAEGPTPFTDVNVSASAAIEPEMLVRTLAEPLESAFPGEVKSSSSRESLKFTIRFAFISCNGQELLQNEHPKQRHDYASKNQSSAAIKVAQDWFGKPPCKGSKAVPLMRAALVEMVAWELKWFMEELEAKNCPVTFCGRKVNFDHLQIANLCRPTPATVQPTLEILPEYRYLYLGGVDAV